MTRNIPEAIRTAVAHKQPPPAKPETKTYYQVVERHEWCFGEVVPTVVECAFATLNEALCDCWADRPASLARKGIIGMLEITYSADLTKILSVKQWSLAQIEDRLQEMYYEEGHGR